MPWSNQGGGPWGSGGSKGPWGSGPQSSGPSPPDLEELLRRPDAANAMAVLNEVCDKICRKISWPTPVPPNETVLFLREFYTAERAFLEREQLYGKARADKFSAPKPLVDPNSE